MQRPQLSIIVPVYNERDQLRPFLDSLASQQNIWFELLLCDGGSTDDTVEEAWRLAQDYPYSIHLLNCAKGRALQMNTGVETAGAETLLFLHVDSRFNDVNALDHGYAELGNAQRKSGGRVAGHFSLKFYRQSSAHHALYYHMECKARLDRKECTHGDQGFMLSRAFFDELGPFDTLYPIAEDTRFAERVRAQGGWVLFPETIETSARRFEAEGIAERQTFNSLLMNFVSIGWTDFFKEAPGVYATQDSTGRLKLAPYLRLIRTLLKRMSLLQQLCFWYGTGRYVHENAWQIPFYFDTRYQYRASLFPGTGVNRRLLFHDKWIRPLLDHPPARMLAGLLTWVWYQYSLLRFAWRSE